ncbi:MAG TPA: HD domain-containing protein [Oscillospiraceae bacterium]|nr:HD domain-containing protein [Oscillospiraceae bacterium]
MDFTVYDKQGGLEGFAIVRSCEKKKARNGSVFLDIILSDKTGEVYAKLWDYKENILPLPEVNSLVKVRGIMQQFNNADQFIIQQIRPVLESDNIDVRDYVKTADYTGEEMYNELFNTVSAFNDDELRVLILAILEEQKEKLLYFPAAFKLHHAINGGLLYHTISIVKLAQAVCDIYPYVDRELLISGAIIHDICKTSEFNVSSMGIAEGYTEKGELVGHLIMGAMYIDKKAQELGISEKTSMLLEHMIISHHGIPEYGSPIRPAFIEAELLSQLDLMDAQMYQMAESLSSVEEGKFTNKIWALDNRKLYSHGRKPIMPFAELDIKGDEEK